MTTTALVSGQEQVALAIHLQANPGQARAWSDVEFALEKDYRVRPDVFLLMQEPVDSVDMQKVPIPGAPDIAVEVISPSERAVDTQAKLEACLRHGAQEVWQIIRSPNPS